MYVDYLFLYCRYKDTLVEYICKGEAERIENGKKCSLNQINQLVRYRDGGTLFQLGGLTNDLKWGTEESLL